MESPRKEGAVLRLSVARDELSSLPPARGPQGLPFPKGLLVKLMTYHTRYLALSIMRFYLFMLCSFPKTVRRKKS